MPRKLDLATLRDREARARARAAVTRKQLAIAHQQMHHAEREDQRMRLAALGEAVERAGFGSLTPEQLEALLLQIRETRTGACFPHEGTQNGGAEQATHATAFLCEKR